MIQHIIGLAIFLIYSHHFLSCPTTSTSTSQPFTKHHGSFTISKIALEFNIHGFYDSRLTIYDLRPHALIFAFFFLLHNALFCMIFAHADGARFK